MESEILDVINSFELENKYSGLIKEYKDAAPLRKWHIWYQLNKIGIKVRWEYDKGWIIRVYQKFKKRYIIN